MNTKEKISVLLMALTLVLVILCAGGGVTVNNTVNAEPLAVAERSNVPLLYSSYDGKVTVTGIDSDAVSNLTEEDKKNMKIVIPATIDGEPVINIESWAFRDISSSGIKVRELDLGGAVNLESIGEEAFERCTSITDVLIFPDNLITIGDRAFNSSGVVINSLPKSLQYIGNRAFYGCIMFDCIEIPDSVVHIGDYAFADISISNIETVWLPKNKNTVYGRDIFDGLIGADNPTPIIVAPSKELYSEFSSSSHNLAKYNLTYETTVTFVVQNGEKIEQTKIFGFPLNYTKSFYWRQDDRYWFPTASKVDHRFLRWTDATLKSIDTNTVVTDNPTYYAEYEMLTFKSEFIQGKGYVINGFTSTYLNSQIEQNIKDIRIEIPAQYDDGINGTNNVVEIGKQAFFIEETTDYKFVSLDLTQAVYLTGIGESAFYECADIKSELLFPDSLTTIGRNAFNKCSGFIGSLIIPNSVTTIEWGAFYGCSMLDGTLKLPENDSFTKIGEYAFQNCTGLRGELLIPNSVYEISTNAFLNCPGFNKLTLPTNTQFKEIGKHAFQLCSGLTGVLNIPNSVNKINDNAFYDCSKLETIYLPNAQDLLWTKTSFGNVTCPIIAYDKGLYEEYRKNTDMAALNNLTYVSKVTFNANGGILSGTSVQEKLCGFPLAYEKNFATLVWSYNSEYNLPTVELSGYIFNGFLNSEENTSIDMNTIVVEEPTYTASYTKIAVTRIEIVSEPGKVNYTAFDTFIRDGMVVKAYYNNGTEKEVASYIIEYSSGNESLRFGDTFVTIVYIEDGVNASVQQEITVEKISLIAPTIAGDYVYNSFLQTVSLNNYDEKTMTLTNNTRLNAGRQEVTVSLKDTNNYKWQDANSEDIALEWIIQTLKVEKPEENNAHFTYTGSAQTYHLEPNNAYTVRNNVQIEAGNYTVEVILKNENDTVNYEWVGEGHETLTFEFIIDRQNVEKPVIANIYTYNGSEITANVVTTEKYTVENNVQINAGKYQIKVTLNKNYKWVDSGTEIIYLEWIINKCELVVVPAFNNQTNVYVGGSLPELTSNYDELGVIGWDAYDLATPEENRAFGWTWVPNDDMNYKEIKGTKIFNVLAVTYEGIVIESSPDKTEYVAFELFDRTGMIVKAKYTNGSSKEINDYQVQYAVGNSFLYGDNKVTIIYEEQGRSEKAEVFVTVSKVVLTKPTIIGDYVYNGYLQTVVLNDFEESKMTLMNNTQTDAGTQEVMVRLKDKVNYQWAGADSEDLKLLWEISCLKIELPSPDLTSFVYDGTEKTYKIDDSEYYKVTGNKHTNAGKYDVVVSITDKVNIQWEDGSNRDILYEFEIDKATHNISGVTFNDRTVVENNEVHTLLVNGLPDGITAMYTGTNGYSAEGVKTAGIYEITVTFVVDDKVNYNELTESMKAILTINNAKLSVEKNDGDKETEIIIVESENGFSPDITIEGREDLQKINKRLKQLIYEISLNNTNEMQDLNYPITIRLFINNEIRNMDNLRVYSIADDGNLSEIEAAVDGDYMVFVVNNLSKFAIVGEDNIPIWIIISTAIIWGLNLIGACIILYYKSKKRKETQKEEKLKEDNVVGANLFVPVLLASGSIPLGLTIAFIIGIIVFIVEIGYLVYMRNKDNNNISVNEDLDYVDEQSRQEFLQSLNELDTEDSDDIAVSEDDEWTAVWADDDINGEEQLEKDSIMRFGGLLYRRSFLAKIIQGSDINKRYYSILKNEFLSYKNTRSSMSITADTIYRKGERLAKFVVAGKTLKLYLALDPLSVEKNFFARDESDKKKYEKTPCCMRIKSSRGMFKAITLITRLMTEKAAVKNPKFVEVDYMSKYPYEDADHLIEKGLIKKILIAGGDENVKADVSKIIRERQDNQNNNTPTEL